MKMNNILLKSSSDEWETPQEVFNYLNGVYKFTLDAASTPQNAKCAEFYTQHQNALIQPWDGRVFLNPPYSKGNQYRFIEKAINEVRNNSKCEIVVALVPARTDTKLWHDLIFKNASEVIFIKGRLKFLNPNNPNSSGNSSTFPSCVVVLEPQLKPSVVFKTWEIGNKPQLL